MNADELARAVATEAAQELKNALARIKHCVNQLSEEQVWWRETPVMNSVGNLMLHLAGNVRQWILAGLGDMTDTRNRAAEFTERGPIPKADLLVQLERAVDDAAYVLRQVTARSLLSRRRIQGFDVTALAALFDCVPHFRGHTQEIIHITRVQLGERYRFAWQPRSREQGAGK